MAAKFQCGLYNWYQRVKTKDLGVSRNDWLEQLRNQARRNHHNNSAAATCNFVQHNNNKNDSDVCIRNNENINDYNESNRLMRNMNIEDSENDAYMSRKKENNNNNNEKDEIERDKNNENDKYANEFDAYKSSKNENNYNESDGLVRNKNNENDKYGNETDTLKRLVYSENDKNIHESTDNKLKNITHLSEKDHVLSRQCEVDSNLNIRDTRLNKESYKGDTGIKSLNVGDTASNIGDTASNIGDTGLNIGSTGKNIGSTDLNRPIGDTGINISSSNVLVTKEAYCTTPVCLKQTNQPNTSNKNKLVEFEQSTKQGVQKMEGMNQEKMTFEKLYDSNTTTQRGRIDEGNMEEEKNAILEESIDEKIMEKTDDGMILGDRKVEQEKSIAQCHVPARGGQGQNTSMSVCHQPSAYPSPNPTPQKTRLVETELEENDDDEMIIEEAEKIERNFEDENEQIEKVKCSKDENLVSHYKYVNIVAETPQKLEQEQEPKSPLSMLFNRSFTSPLLMMPQDNTGVCEESKDSSFYSPTIPVCDILSPGTSDVNNTRDIAASLGTNLSDCEVSWSSALATPVTAMQLSPHHHSTIERITLHPKQKLRHSVLARSLFTPQTPRGTLSPNNNQQSPGLGIIRCHSPVLGGFTQRNTGIPSSQEKTAPHTPEKESCLDDFTEASCLQNNTQGFRVSCDGVRKDSARNPSHVIETESDTFSSLELGCMQNDTQGFKIGTHGTRKEIMSNIESSSTEIKGDASMIKESVAGNREEQLKIEVIDKLGSPHFRPSIPPVSTSTPVSVRAKFQGRHLPFYNRILDTPKNIVRETVEDELKLSSIKHSGNNSETKSTNYERNVGSPYEDPLDLVCSPVHSKKHKYITDDPRYTKDDIIGDYRYMKDDPKYIKDGHNYNIDDPRYTKDDHNYNIDDPRYMKDDHNYISDDPQYTENSITGGPRYTKDDIDNPQYTKDLLNHKTNNVKQYSQSENIKSEIDVINDKSCQDFKNQASMFKKDTSSSIINQEETTLPTRDEFSLPTEEKSHLPTGKPSLPTDQSLTTGEKDSLPTLEKSSLPTGEDNSPTGGHSLPTGENNLPKGEKESLPTGEQSLPTGEKSSLPTREKDNLPTGEMAHLPTDEMARLPIGDHSLPTDDKIERIQKDRTSLFKQVNKIQSNSSSIFGQKKKYENLIGNNKNNNNDNNPSNPQPTPITPKLIPQPNTILKKLSLKKKKQNMSKFLYPCTNDGAYDNMNIKYTDRIVDHTEIPQNNDIVVRKDENKDISIEKSEINNITDEKENRKDKSKDINTGKCEVNNNTDEKDNREDKNKDISLKKGEINNITDEKDKSKDISFEKSNTNESSAASYTNMHTINEQNIGNENKLSFGAVRPGSLGISNKCTNTHTINKQNINESNASSYTNIHSINKQNIIKKDNVDGNKKTKLIVEESLQVVPEQKPDEISVWDQSIKETKIVPISQLQRQTYSQWMDDSFSHMDFSQLDSVSDIERGNTNKYENGNDSEVEKGKMDNIVCKSGFGGFLTGSGKKRKIVSEESLKEVRKILKDDEQNFDEMTVPASSFPSNTENQRRVNTDKKDGERGKDFDEMRVPAASIHTEYQRGVNSETLRMAKRLKHVDDNRGSTSMPATIQETNITGQKDAVAMSIKPVTSSEWHTVPCLDLNKVLKADGKLQEHVANKRLNPTLNKDEETNKTMDNHSSVNPMNPVKIQSEVTEFTKTSGSSVFQGFKTGKGIEVKVKESSLKQAQRLWIEEEEKEVQLSSRQTQKQKPTEFQGFKTGKGVDVKVKESSLKQAQRLWIEKEEKQVTGVEVKQIKQTQRQEPEFQGFKTGKGIDIKVKESSLKQAQRLCIEEEEKEVNLSLKQTQRQQEPPEFQGFKTGKGIDIKVKESSLKQARKLWMEEEEKEKEIKSDEVKELKEAQKQQEPEFQGFKTGKGVDVKVKESSLKQAQRLWIEEEKEKQEKGVEVKQLKQTHRQQEQPEFQGFKTGKGIDIKVKESSLKQAQRLWIEEEEKEKEVKSDEVKVLKQTQKQQEPEFQGFKTGKGIDVRVKESSLKQAQRLWIEEEEKEKDEASRSEEKLLGKTNKTDSFSSPAIVSRKNTSEEDLLKDFNREGSGNIKKDKKGWILSKRRNKRNPIYTRSENYIKENNVQNNIPSEKPIDFECHIENPPSVSYSNSKTAIVSNVNEERKEENQATPKDGELNLEIHSDIKTKGKKMIVSEELNKKPLINITNEEIHNDDSDIDSIPGLKLKNVNPKDIIKGKKLIVSEELNNKPIINITKDKTSEEIQDDFISEQKLKNVNSKEMKWTSNDSGIKNLDKFPSKFQGFSTARGGKVSLNEASLTKAQALFKDIDEEQILNNNDNTTEIDKVKSSEKYTGNNSNSDRCLVMKEGDNVKIGIDVIGKDQEKTSVPFNFQGFSTARGGKVSLNEASLMKAQALFKDIDEEQILNNNDKSKHTINTTEINQMELSEKYTDSNKSLVMKEGDSVKIEEEDRRRRVIDVICKDQEKTSVPLNFQGFSTARGGKVSLNEASLMKAQALFKNIDEEDMPNSAIDCPVVNTGTYKSLSPIYENTELKSPHSKNSNEHRSPAYEINEVKSPVSENSEIKSPNAKNNNGIKSHNAENSEIKSPVSENSEIKSANAGNSEIKSPIVETSDESRSPSPILGSQMMRRKINLSMSHKNPKTLQLSLDSMRNTGTQDMEGVSRSLPLIEMDNKHSRPNHNGRNIIKDFSYIPTNTQEISDISDITEAFLNDDPWNAMPFGMPLRSSQRKRRRVCPDGPTQTQETTESNNKKQRREIETFEYEQVEVERDGIRMKEEEIEAEREVIRMKQEELIKDKEKTCIEQLEGSLYKTRMENKNNRLKLKSLGSLKVCQNMRREIMVINPSSALHYRFQLNDISCKVLECTDGCNIVPGVDGCIGVNEIERGLLATPGIHPKLLHSAWVRNHYKFIVWNLAALERQLIHEPVLTIDNVVSRLKYRYDREIDRAQRPIFRKLTEQDDAPQKTMVVCVTAIGSDLRLEVTDGWYSIGCVCDEAMRRLIDSGKVRVGTKLVIQGAELTGNQACHPLDAPSTLCLRIHTNLCRRARWWAKLGLLPYTTGLPTKLKAIEGNGGLVGKIEVYLARVYPVEYYEREDGKAVFRGEKAHIRKLREMHMKKDITLDQIVAQVERELAQKEKENVKRCPTKDEIANLNTGEDIARLMENSLDPTEIQGLLTWDQIQLAQIWNEQEADRRRRRINTEVQEKLSKKMILYEPTPVIKIRVVDNEDTDAIITIWRPTEDMLQALTEGTFFSIQYPMASEFRYGSQQLKNTRQTKWQVINPSFPINYPRIVTPYVPEVLPAWREVDIAGIVLRVGQSHPQLVYIIDQHTNILILKFWDGLCGYDDIVTVGSVIAILNGSWQGHSERFACVNITERAIITNFPRKPHLIEAITNFKNTVKDMKKLLHDGNMKLDNIKLNANSDIPVVGMRSRETAEAVGGKERDIAEAEEKITEIEGKEAELEKTVKIENTETGNESKSSENQCMSEVVELKTNSKIVGREKKDVCKKLTALNQYGMSSFSSNIHSPASDGARKPFRAPFKQSRGTPKL